VTLGFILFSCGCMAYGTIQSDSSDKDRSVPASTFTM
jgi:hypothetical protein